MIFQHDGECWSWFVRDELVLTTVKDFIDAVVHMLYPNLFCGQDQVIWTWPRLMEKTAVVWP
jgi:hypothetical protein